MPAARRVAANQVVLSALLERHEARPVDLSRILHHAAEVGDEEVIVAFGPAAAAEAVAAVLAPGGGGARAPRAAAPVLVHARGAGDDPEPARDRDLHDRAGRRRRRRPAGRGRAAAPARRPDAARHRPAVAVPDLLVGRRPAEGRGERRRGDRGAVRGDGQRPGDRDRDLALAWALSNQAQLLVLAGRAAEAIAVGERAVAMARELDDPGVLSHALDTVGTAAWDLGRGDGPALLDESLRVALDAGEVEHACRAYVNIAWHLADDLRLDEADRVLDRSIELAEEAEFLGFLRYMHVMRGSIQVARGRWDEAEREAEWAVDAQPTMQCPAFVVAGRARARRGDETGTALLTRAWELAVRLAEAQRLGPAGSALLEAAWLRGAAADAAALVAPWYDEVFRHGYPTVAAELGYWLRAAGHDVPLPAVEHPYAMLAQGRWREAEAAWARAGSGIRAGAGPGREPGPGRPAGGAGRPGRAGRRAAGPPGPGPAARPGRDPDPARTDTVHTRQSGRPDRASTGGRRAAGGRPDQQ